MLQRVFTITPVSKKAETKLMAVSHQILTNFQNSFTGRFSSKVAVTTFKK